METKYMKETTLENTTQAAPAAGVCNCNEDACLTPEVNIYESAEGYTLEAAMPGVGKDGLEVSVENDELTIQGRRSGEPAGLGWLHRESRPFNYRRVFQLDPAIDTGRIEARINQGLLVVTLPKSEQAKPRKISVAG